MLTAIFLISFCSDIFPFGLSTLLLLLYSIYIRLRSRRNIETSGILLFVSVLFFGALGAYNAVDYTDLVRVLSGFLLVDIVMCRSALNHKNLQQEVKYIFYGAIIISLIHLIGYMGLIPDIGYINAKQGENIRFVGPSINPNNFSFYLFSSFLGYKLICTEHNRKFMIAIDVIFILLLILAASRSIVLSTLIFFFFFTVRLHIIRIMLFAIILVVFFAVIRFTLPQDIIYRYDVISAGIFETQNRGEIIQYYLSSFANNPYTLFVGTGFPGYVDGYVTDNSLLRILNITGIPFLLLLMSAFVYYATKYIKYFDKNVIAICLALLTSLMFNDWILTKPFYYIVGLILVSLITKRRLNPSVDDYKS